MKSGNVAYKRAVTEIDSIVFTITGLKVTNCEFGWIGGSLQPGQGTTRYGNAIEIWGGCRDYSVDHCYIYQVYDAGITHQWANTTSTQPVIMENVTYSNNLIEYCTYSIEYFLNQPNSENDLMKNILIKNNIWDKLIFIGAEKEASLPIMQNNIYIQSKGEKFGFYGMNHERDELMFDSGIDELLIKEGIEKNPTVIFDE